MSFLAMGNEWWSVTGLCFDVVGFGLLALDLLPEYLNNRDIRMVKNARERFQELVENSQDPFINTPGTLLQQILRDRRPNTKPRFQHTLDNLRRWYLKSTLKSVSYPPQEKSENNSGILDRYSEYQDYGTKIQSALAHLNERKSQLEVRTRPPILLAVGLVVFGFFFQALGAIPTDPPAPVVFQLPGHFYEAG